jgi:hypothetical protein
VKGGEDAISKPVCLNQTCTILLGGLGLVDKDSIKMSDRTSRIKKQVYFGWKKREQISLAL